MIQEKIEQYTNAKKGSFINIFDFDEIIVMVALSKYYKGKDIIDLSKKQDIDLRIEV